MARQNPRTGAPRLQHLDYERIRKMAAAEPLLQVVVAGFELRELANLALTTFNDFGTSGAELDEELCQIDDALERAGFEPGNTKRSIRLLVAQAKRRAVVTCDRCLRTTARKKPRPSRTKRKGR